MNEKTEQEQIIEEAKKLNLDVSDVFVSKIASFLSSDLNKSELNPTSLKQVTQELSEKLDQRVKTDED